MNCHCIYCSDDSRNCRLRLKLVMQTALSGRLPYLVCLVVPALAVATAISCGCVLRVPRKACADIVELYLAFTPYLRRCISSATLALVLGVVGLLVALLRCHGCWRDKYMDVMGKKTKTETSDNVTVASGKVAEMSTGLTNGTLEAGHLAASTTQTKVKMNDTESETMANYNSSPLEEVEINTVVFQLDSPVGSGTTLADSIAGSGTGLTDSASGSGIDQADLAQGNGITAPEVEGATGASGGEKAESSQVTEDKTHPEHADKFDTDAVSGNGTYVRNHKTGKPVFLR